MSDRVVTLRSGEEMNIKIVTPPLTEYSRRSPSDGLVNWVWREIKDEIISGQMSNWLYTPYAIGEIQGEFVGSMAYYTSVQNKEVGLIEFVETLEHQRGKGIASALLSALIEKFNSEGGVALMLCTGNPIAGKLYENHGFWYSVGDGLRYLSPGAEKFEDTFFAYSGDVNMREATWADLPGVSVLYNHRKPNWLIKDYLTDSFRDMRYEYHFIKMMRRVEDYRGGYLVLESPNKRIVGAAVFERIDTFHEQHVAVLGFRIVPEYFGQAQVLLSAVIEKALRLSIKVLQIHIGERDHDQIELVRSAGFVEEARLSGRLRDGEDIVDMLVYTHRLPGDPESVRGVEDYYGGRKSWMLQRIVEGPR